MDNKMLNDAFRAFNETTMRFQESYAILEKKVAFLSQELAEKNAVLHHKMAEVEQTQNYLNSILESITDGVVALNLDGMITTFNKAAQKISHYSAKELLQKKYSELFFVEGVNESKERSVFEEMSFPTGKEIEIKNKLGGTIPIVAYTSHITDEHGEIRGLVVTFNDLSKIKHLENEIARAKRLSALGEMAAGVAHEIRNPLGGIEMFASLLERECKEDERKTTIARNIVQGVRGVNKIITEMLTFTKTFRQIRAEKINLVDCIESALCFAQPEIQAKGIEVVRVFNHVYSVCVMGDEDQLRQVFLNLFLNAGQAIQHYGGSIQIVGSSYVRDRYVSIEVTDDGVGIAKEAAEKIFDPFFTTKSTGTGLGLAVSYRIIEAHGGKIWVKSSEGEGTTMTIHLPLVQGE